MSYSLSFLWIILRKIYKKNFKVFISKHEHYMCVCVFLYKCAFNLWFNTANYKAWKARKLGFYSSTHFNKKKMNKNKKNISGFLFFFPIITGKLCEAFPCNTDDKDRTHSNLLTMLIFFLKKNLHWSWKLRIYVNYSFFFSLHFPSWLFSQSSTTPPFAYPLLTQSVHLAVQIFYVFSVLNKLYFLLYWFLRATVQNLFKVQL